MTTNTPAVRARTSPPVPRLSDPQAVPIPIRVTQTWGSRAAVTAFWFFVTVGVVLAVAVIFGSLTQAVGNSY